MHNCGDLVSCPFTFMLLEAGEGWIEILYKFAWKPILQCIFPPFRPDTLKSYHKKSQDRQLVESAAPASELSQQKGANFDPLLLKTWNFK